MKAIYLQKKVINYKEDELKSLRNCVHDEDKSTAQTTVDTGFKNYSFALSKTCWAGGVVVSFRVVDSFQLPTQEVGGSKLFYLLGLCNLLRFSQPDDRETVIEV